MKRAWMEKGELTLEGKIISANLIDIKLIYVHIGRDGYITESATRDIAEREMPMGAEAYVIGDNPFEAWSSDPGFGSCTKVYPIAYLKMKNDKSP